MTPRLNRNLQLYVLARSFVWLTNSFMFLVFGMWTNDLTGSVSLAGMAVLFAVAPRVIGVFAGSLLDSLPRRPTLVVASAASAGVLLLLLFVRGPEDVWIIWAVSAAYGLLGVFLQSAAAGSLKSLASDDELPFAMSLINGSAGILQLFGPVAGAALYAASGPHVVAVTVAGLCLLSAGLMLLVRVPPSGEERVPGVMAGLRSLSRVGDLRDAIVALVLVQATVGLVDGSLYALVAAFDAPSAFAGVIVGVQGAGALLGALGSYLVVERIRERRAMAIGMIGAALALFGIILALPVQWLALVFVFAGGLFFSLVLTAFGVLFQRTTPENVIGRAQAALGALQSVPIVISLGLGAFLVSVVDFRALYAVTASAAVVIGAFLWVSSRSRRAPA